MHIKETKNGSEVAAIDPVTSMQAVDDPELGRIAGRVGEPLKGVVDGTLTSARASASCSRGHCRTRRRPGILNGHVDRSPRCLFNIAAVLCWGSS